MASVLQAVLMHGKKHVKYPATGTVTVTFDGQMQVKSDDVLTTMRAVFKAA